MGDPKRRLVAERLSPSAWRPFPVGDAPVLRWNLQGKRYAEDNTCIELEPALGSTFEISRSA